MGENLKKRNYSVDYFKYFCALMIISIHLRPLDAFSKDISTIFEGTLPRIAVPFFFVASGYYFAKKLYQDKKPLKEYLQKLFAVYTFWSAAYAVRPILTEAKRGGLNANFFKELVFKYLFFGISEHLWFCLALAVSVILLTLLHNLKMQKAVVWISAFILVLSCVVLTYYDSFGTNIILIHYFYEMPNFITVFRLLLFGPCYVFLGDFICRKEEQLLKSDKNLIAFLIIFIILHTAEKAFNVFHGDNLLLNFTLYPLVLLIFLVLLYYPGKGNSAFSRYSRNASAFTYYSHGLLIFAFKFIIPNQFIRYFFVAGATLLISGMLTKINNKKLNYVLM